MSVYIPHFFTKLKAYVSKFGTRCTKPEGGIVLDRGLILARHSIYFEGRCIQDGELAWALKTTGFPDCTEKKNAERIGPPYLEYYADSDYALALVNGGDGVYLLENVEGAVSCVCKTNIDLEDYLKSHSILERWLRKLM